MVRPAAAKRIETEVTHSIGGEVGYKKTGTPTINIFEGDNRVFYQQKQDWNSVLFLHNPK